MFAPGEMVNVFDSGSDSDSDSDEDILMSRVSAPVSGPITLSLSPSLPPPLPPSPPHTYPHTMSLMALFCLQNGVESGNVLKQGFLLKKVSKLTVKWQFLLGHNATL